MKTNYVTMTGFLLGVALAIGCSGGSTDGAGETSSAVSQGSGPCGAPVLQVIVKAKEHRFGVNDNQVALNPAIPIQNICQNGVIASCKAACAKAEAAAVATGVKGFSGSNVPAQLRAMGQLADAFNAALGSRTDFADHPIDQDPGVTNPSTDPNASTTTAAPSGDGGSGSSSAGGGATAASCSATVLEVIVQGQEHRFGFDNQQVALNPAIPIQDICQRVTATCSSACASAGAVAAATGVRGFSGPDNPTQLRQMGALADRFNATLGNSTDFADHPILH